jgi:DNA-binding transcriptional MerR regulator
MPMRESPDEMTIDELARAADVVVSTVRLYQNQGLLPAPVRRGRVGWYGAGHLRRLRLIAELQGRRFSLASIKQLLDGMEKGESLRAVLGLGDEPSSWVPEQPRTMSLGEPASHLPQVQFDTAMMRRIVDLGLVELAEGGRDVVVRSPAFLGIGGELAAMGVPVDVILDQYAALQDDATRIAERFTDVFRTHLWEPFVEQGMPTAQVAELLGALEKLGPLAEGVVLMSLRDSLQAVAERFVEREPVRLGVDIPRPGRSAGSA